MLTCNVIPMGWKLAVGIVQHCMRELVRRSEVMPAELELRRDRPPPVDENFFVQKSWQNYIDDLSRGTTSESSMPPAEDGWLLTARQTGEALGFIFDDGEKKQQDALDSLSLGSEVDGRQLVVRPKGKRLWEMFGISFSMLSDAQPSLKDCEITAGLWVHVAQYRKAVLAGVDCLWQVLLGETA